MNKGRRGGVERGIGVALRIIRRGKSRTLLTVWQNLRRSGMYRPTVLATYLCYVNVFDGEPSARLLGYGSIPFAQRDAQVSLPGY